MPGCLCTFESVFREKSLKSQEHVHLKKLVKLWILAWKVLRIQGYQRSLFIVSSAALFYSVWPMVGQPAALLHIKIKRVSLNDICGHLWLTTRNSHFTKIGFHNGAKSEGRVRVTKTPFMYVCMYIYIICLVQVYRVSVQFILVGILLLAVCNHWPESRVEGRFSLSVVLTRSQHLPPVFTAQFSTVHVGIVLVWAQRKNREGKHLVCILRWTRLWFLFVELMGTLTLT